MIENDTMSPDDVNSLKTSVFNSQPVFNPNTGEPKPQDQDGASPSTNDTQPAAQQPIDINVIVREKFGVDNIDEVVSGWNEYRQYKESPPPPPEIKYENELSKTIHQYLQNGEYKKVKEYLDGKDMLESLSSMSEEDKLKLWIKTEYPAYGVSNEVLDAKYKKTYSFDESQYKDEVDGTITDHVGLSLAKAEAQQRRIDDIKKATEFFQKFGEQIKLNPLKSEQEKDANYESYKQLVANDDKEAAFIASELPKLTENDISFIAKFEDSDNKGLSFDAVVTPDKQSLDIAKKAVFNFWDFVNTHYKDKDGLINVKELTQDVDLILNKGKYAQSWIKQGATEGIRWHIAQNKPGTDLTGRNFRVDEPNEVESLRQSVFGHRNGVAAHY